jgi:hypothetical protein
MFQSFLRLGDVGCCNAFWLALGDGFGCAFGCERTMGLGISFTASYSRCLKTTDMNIVNPTSGDLFDYLLANDAMPLAVLQMIEINEDDGTKSVSS